MPSVHFHVSYRCPASWRRGRAGGRILTLGGSQMIESLLGPSSNRNQVTDVNDKSMTGTTLLIGTFETLKVIEVFPDASSVTDRASLRFCSDRGK